MSVEKKIVYVCQWTSEWKGDFSLLDILKFVDDGQVVVYLFLRAVMVIMNL